MSGYQYDDILQSHLRGVTKVAFWGAAAAAAPRLFGAVRAAGPAVANFGSKLMGGLRSANAAVQPLMSAAQNVQTARGVMSAANNPQRPATTASLREKSAAVYRFKG